MIHAQLVLPEINGANHRVILLATVGKGGAGSGPIVFGKECLAQRAHIVEEQRCPMTDCRVGGSRRIAHEHHAVAGYLARPGIAVGEEADGAGLLDLNKRTFRHELAGERDQGGKDEPTPVSRKRSAVITT